VWLAGAVVAYGLPSIVTSTEIVIVGLGCVGMVAGLSVALVAAAGNRKTTPVLSFCVSVGRVVFAGGLALFIGSFATVLHAPLGKEVDLVFALAGKALGIGAALLGGYAEEHAKYSLAHLS
jgi:uncharacterized YccA/Bax inhibitor family protein